MELLSTATYDLADADKSRYPKAKRQLEVRLIGGLTTAHSLASRIGRDTVTFDRVRPLEERLMEYYHDDGRLITLRQLQLPSGVHRTRVEDNIEEDFDD